MTVSFGGVAGGAANVNSGRSLAPQTEVGSSGRIRTLPPGSHHLEGIYVKVATPAGRLASTLTRL
jgi:hypothetical protein